MEEKVLYERFFVGSLVGSLLCVSSFARTDGTYRVERKKKEGKEVGEA